MDTDDTTKSNVEEQTSATEELKRMEKETDNENNVKYKDKSAKDKLEDLNGNSYAKREGQSSKNTEEENLKTKETKMSKKDIDKRTNMVSEDQSSVREESESLDKDKDCDKGNEEVKDNSDDLNETNPSLTDNKVKSDEGGIETAKKKDMDRAERTKMISEDQCSAAEEPISLDKDKDSDKSIEEGKDKSNSLNGSKPPLTDIKVKSDGIGSETLKKKKLEKKKENLNTSTSKRCGIKILIESDDDTDSDEEDIQSMIVAEIEKKDNSEIRKQEHTKDKIYSEDREQGIWQELNIEIPKDKVTEDQQLHFEVQEIHHSIESQESGKYSKDNTDELQQNPVITLVKKEVKDDHTTSTEVEIINQQKALIDQLIRQTGIMSNKNKELENNLKLTEEELKSTKTLLEEELSRSTTFRQILKEKEDELGKQIKAGEEMKQKSDVGNSNSIRDCLPPMRKASLIQEIFTVKEIEVRSPTKNASDKKDISDICDVCKRKPEDQSKFVLKEVLERELQKYKTTIQKKDEEIGLKEAEIRSLSLEIKKFENNKKTAASELTTLKSKIREVTLQKETLEEVNKHLELEAMTKDQELTKRADKGTT